FGHGVFVIASYWAALTSAWLVASFYRDSDMRDEFKGQILAWSCLLLPIAVLFGWSFGWYCAGIAACLWFMPLLHVVRDLMPHTPPKPSYSRAVARMNFDKFEEAEMAVINELEKCEDDFNGWLLLAALYAVHFHDLLEAERTLLDTCNNPATTDSQRAVALNKLADWRLKLANDPVGARRHLETIREMMPGAHMAHMAELRLRQLPATREAYLESVHTKKIRLPALRHDFDESNVGPSETQTGPSDAERAESLLRARRLAEKLQANPNNISEREQLARVLAEKLGQTDAALEQLDLLLALPEQAPPQTAEWLALSAAWRLKYKRDESAGRRILERLVRDFPETAQGFAAQRRLNLMEMEAKMRALWPRPAVATEPPNITVPG